MNHMDLPCLKPEDFKSVSSWKGLILVLFYADWCPFCRRFLPLFEDAAKKTSLCCKIAQVNEDDNPLWEKYSISTVPTVIAFKDGKISGRIDAEPGIGLKKTNLAELLQEA